MAEAHDERLLRGVERIERLQEERKGIADDIRDVYAELKAVGYDPRMVRWLVEQRAMKPEDRSEQGLLQETYAAAIGMADAEPGPSIADLRPDAAAIALNMMTAEIVMLEDPAHAAALIDHVLCLLDLRAEIALLRQQESARKHLAKEEGFDAKQLAVTVRWLEKCAKHGEDLMRAGEATFHLYRGTFEARPTGDSTPVSDDAKLAGMFTPEPPAKKSPTLKQRHASDAIAMAAVSRMNRGIG